MSLRAVFAGTPDFALPSLAALLDAGHGVAAVYTRPDRPAGRGRGPRPSPVKRFAQERGLDLRQPASLEGEAEVLRGLAPDVMVVVAYGLLLPRAVLDIPRHGCVNVHASLLPRWRGAAPIQRAIEAGDSVTGVTIMQMDAGLDTGPILAQARTPIRPTDTGGSLHDRLAALGAQELVGALHRLEAGELQPRPQDEAGACYADKIRKQEAVVDWAQPAVVIGRRIRAFNPWPVASTDSKWGALRLWEATLMPDAVTAPPGTVLRADAQGICVACGTGALCLRRLQAPGGRPMAAGAFLNGHLLVPGDRLGAGGRP